MLERPRHDVKVAFVPGNHDEALREHVGAAVGEIRLKHGHIHASKIRELDGITYINCGDWVDSFNAIVEHMDGRMELIEWGVVSQAADREPSIAQLTEDSSDDQTRQAA